MRHRLEREDRRQALVYGRRPDSADLTTFANRTGTSPLSSSLSGAARRRRRSGRVETSTGLYLNDVLPELAARRLSEIDLALEPIGPEHLFRVAAVPAPEYFAALDARFEHVVDQRCHERSDRPGAEPEFCPAAGTT